MKLEVLSHIVIKFGLGLFMLAQSLYHIVIYSSYILKLEMYLFTDYQIGNSLLMLLLSLLSIWLFINRCYGDYYKKMSYL